MNRTILWIIVILIIIVGSWLIFFRRSGTSNTASSTPTYSDTSDIGKTAANIPLIGSLASSSDIVVDSPKQGTVISSPLTVSGKARGSWFFEASAPVIIVDTDGKTLGTGHIEAQGDWMTTTMVPFKGTIEFAISSSTPDTGAIVFMNDNPSGMASTSRFMAVPVYLYEK